MKCEKCDDKGFVESYCGIHNSWTPSISQCPNRCNLAGYSKEVQRRLNNPNHVTERPVLSTVAPKPKLQVVAPIYPGKEMKDDNT